MSRGCTAAISASTSGTTIARHGLLGHASLLTVTSYANRTSVVLRGKWVLETLLGSPPPPPPPNVRRLPRATGPTRPRCAIGWSSTGRIRSASCHRRMDPLGFAMEHFDAVGRWRETDGGAPINAEIDLSGRTVNSPRTLREALLAEGDREFVRTVAEKMLNLRVGPWRAAHRSAAAAADCGSVGSERRAVVDAGWGGRRERSVPDAAGAGAGRRRACGGRSAVSSRLTRTVETETGERTSGG